jgi:hypothetical protein
MTVTVTTVMISWFQSLSKKVKGPGTQSRRAVGLKEIYNKLEMAVREGTTGSAANLKTLKDTLGYMSGRNLTRVGELIVTVIVMIGILIICFLSSSSGFRGTGSNAKSPLAQSLCACAFRQSRLSAR